MVPQLGRHYTNEIIGAILAILWCTPAPAQNFPARPVRIVVPFATGGPVDIVGRILAQHLSEELGQSFIVDNRAGAGSVIGTEAVVRSAADGYTLLFSSNTAFAVTPATQKSLPYDAGRDLAVIAMVAHGPQALVVRSTLGVGSLAALISMAKANPGKLTFASSGPGTIIHMAGELFKYHAGIAIEHVPYRGGGPAVNAMLGGEVDMMVNDLSPVIGQIRQGSLKALAVAASQRAAAIPDVPTFADGGLPQVISSSWFAVGAPAKVAPAVVATLSDAVDRIKKQPAFAARLAQLGLEPYSMSPAEAKEFIGRELERWRGLVATAGVKIE